MRALASATFSVQTGAARVAHRPVAAHGGRAGANQQWPHDDAEPSNTGSNTQTHFAVLFRYEGVAAETHRRGPTIRNANNYVEDRTTRDQGLSVPKPGKQREFAQSC
jgi:hypothetical protein